MRFTGSDREHLNEATIADGAVIDGVGIRLVNTERGRIVGGVTFAQGGSSLINQAGGVIRVADGASEFTTVAVTGSAGADTVENGGAILGLVSLGDGADLFRQGGTFESRVGRVDLGTGDDRLEITGPLAPVADGGAGRDRLLIANGGGSIYYGTNFMGFEELAVIGGAQLVQASGYQSIAVQATAIQGGLGLIESANPNAPVSLTGYLRLHRSSVASVAGGDGSDDWVESSAGSTIAGAVRLGGGDDRFSLTNAFDNPAAIMPAGGVDGGAGRDRFDIRVRPGEARTYDFSGVTGFELLRVNAEDVAAGSARVASATGFTSIVVGSTGSLTLSGSMLTGANLDGAFGGAITLEAGSAIRRYGRPDEPFWDQRIDLQQGDDRQSTRLVNAGRIEGEVRFYVGDDTYDGSTGSVGGTVYGNAGNDRLIGGAGAERLEGGFGADTLIGNAGDDVLIGDAGADELRGGGGADSLIGDDGNDLLVGDIGDDRIDGGAGVDTAVFAGARGASSVTRLANGQIQVAGQNGTDTLTGVEKLRFDDAEIDLAGPLFAAPALAVRNFGASPGAGGWESQTLFARQMGDVNGDGRADIVAFGYNGTFVALGQANGSFAEAKLGIANFGVGPAAGGWESGERYPRLVADVNGDGRADIVGFGESATYVALGRADGTFSAAFTGIANFGAGPGGGGWGSQGFYPRALADANGDGRADIFGFGFAGTYVALANADGTFGEARLAIAQFGRGVEAGGWFRQNDFTRLVGDVNGDGRADIMGFSSYAGTSLSLGTASGGFTAPAPSIDNFARGWTQDRHTRQLADVNGDGFDDIVGFAETGTYVALANGTGGFGAAQLAGNIFGAGDGAGGWTSNDRYPRMLADVNGDGLADIVGFGNDGVSLALAVALVPIA